MFEVWREEKKKNDLIGNGKNADERDAVKEAVVMKIIFFGLALPAVSIKWE